MFWGLTYKVWGFIAAGLVLIGLVTWGISSIKQSGRDEVTMEIQNQNANLTNHVAGVNENLVGSSVNAASNIDRNSRDIEDVINDQPTETISNVSRARLERLREQQSVRKTNR